MRIISRMETGAALMVCLLLIIAGCASPHSRFYTLNVGKSLGNVRPSTGYRLLVALGPVQIPDYLDRPQIVIRTGRNELTFSEFDRWAGSLKDNIAQVLSEDLTRLLSRNGVSVSPWEWGAASDYRVSVDIRRIDIMTDGYVLLDCQWSIIGKDGIKILLTRQSSAKESVSAPTYPARISSMSKALKKVSRDIAAGIKAVSGANR